ncbi:hypothetical protein SO802_026342 [Lithocarpus litseifolius]|uniref:Uncharacterized protein n=1 Tax=Lithocarpus litseifolius TaxID=425828 RepID=A0AAW2C160_9ROSI
MTTSMEDSMAQKILKALDEHEEVLKKMGGRLTRLEQSRLKKPSHVEINDDEDSFGKLCDCGTRIEDAINNGQLEKGESMPLTRKTYGGGATTTKAPNPINGIWDEEDEVLKEVVVVWGILPKGVTELKKRVLEDNVANITRSGKHYKPSFLEKDHPGRDLGEGSKEKIES